MSLHAFPTHKKTPAKTKAVILPCTCGGKYIKTRPGQTVCLRCVSKENREHQGK